MSLAEQFSEIAGRATLEGPLGELRQAHLGRFRRAGLPTPKNENWKYTSLRALEGMEFQLPAGEEHALAPEDLSDFLVPGLDGWRLTFVNGVFAPSLSYLDDLPDGCRLTALSPQTDLPDWALKLLGEPFEARDEGFASLNGALAGQGLVLHVAKGVELERPIECLHISVGAEVSRLVNLRHLLVLEAGARVRLLEQFVGGGETGNLHNVVLQARLEDSASLAHLRLQQESDSGFLVTRSDIDQARGSRYLYDGFDLGGRLVRHDINARLLGEEALCRLHGVYALNGRRHVDNHTRVDHVSPNARSEEFFKGVLDGSARAVFNGKVVVHKGADGTDARQTNANLLLSRKAEIDTKPELVIYADDVKCAHGATVGQLDDTQLFYLRSRGIPEQEARLLLTYAFCREVVDKLENEDLRDYIAERIVAHLPCREALEDVS